MTESASSIDGEYVLGEGGVDYCDINIDLKNGTTGEIYMYGDTINILENVGWSSTSTPGEYQTDSSNADVDITLYATEIDARLID